MHFTKIAKRRRIGRTHLIAALALVSMLVTVGTLLLLKSGYSRSGVTYTANAGTAADPPAVPPAVDRLGRAVSLDQTTQLTVARSKADSSGTTIPDTNYMIPRGAVFMSPAGSDGNPGTRGAPVRSVARAIAITPAGGTIVLRGGVYRDGSSVSITKKLTFQAYPHEQPWFDGTDVVNNWKSAGGGVWYTDWATPSFCNGQYYSRPYSSQRSDNTGPCTHVDMSKAPDNPAAGDPQMAFVDGRYVHEVTSRGQVKGGDFFYDQAARRLYLGSDPAAHTVELTARASALVFQGGPGGDTVRGIGFRRFATNEFSGNITHGAVLFNSPEGTTENTVFTRNAGAGLSYANAKGAAVRSSIFAKNGFNGLDANGTHVGSGVVDDMDIEDNLFDGNNTEHFGTDCSLSCAAAGSKMAHMVGLTLKNNIFQNNFGKGFWCDLYCSNVTIVDNVFRNNASSGLMYEVSRGGVIASNLIYGNSGYGFKGGSGDLKFYNNTIADNQNNILMYDDSREPSGSEVAPNTTNIDMANNVIYGGNATDFQNLKGQTAANQLYATLDYDSFIRPRSAPSALVEWHATADTALFSSLARFRDATGYETHGQDVVTDAPTFVDMAANDYRIRGDSTVKGPGKALPAVVAEALGLPSGTVPNRGALDWPGRLG